MAQETNAGNVLHWISQIKGAIAIMRHLLAWRSAGVRSFIISILFAASSVTVISLPSISNANCLGSLAATTGEAQDAIFFPNWVRAYAASFDIADWLSDCGLAGCLSCHPAAGDSCGGGTAVLQISNLTIANFGTAVAGTDIKAVYWAGGTIAAPNWHTMTMVAPQMWTWAWNGVEVNPDMQIAGPLWNTIRVYVDIGDTPTDGATVKMGIPYDPIAFQGGIADMCCCNMGWGDVSNSVPKTIKYVAKFVDKISAAPGDTLNYTIYYGRPGTTNLQNLVIIDTQPPYTHWNGVASVVPDPGWDPNWSPPPKLRWTLFPAAVAVAGGPTGQITFQMTIDWGNGESFEPGSGDVAAPENLSLWNNATGFFPNLPVGQWAHKSNNTRTTVMRFLFWKIADRDVLYNNSPSAIDEITYSIFIKNMSATKTWWGVSIWDTVPAQVNPWAVDCGLDDSCVGWTMTPTGCVAGGGGRVISAGKTIITWKLDMPPYMTLTVRWKAKVTAAAQAGQTCINKASVLEFGKTNIVDGTGHSISPRNFTHEAPIVMRTTYVSYVAYNSGGGGSYFINFYPLHPSAAWQLFRLRLGGMVNGVQGSIVAPAPATPCNSWPGPGCMVGIERVPGYYGLMPQGANQDYYKLVSNAPVLWEVAPQITAMDEDSEMFSTFTTLSYRGKTCYTYCRSNSSGVTSLDGDYLGIMNTENMATTIHIFKWNGAVLDWDYRESRTIEALSQYCPGGTAVADQGDYKIISSDSSLMIQKYSVLGTDFDTFVTMAAATNGLVVAKAAGDEFWFYTSARAGAGSASVVNIGGAVATFELYGYGSEEMFPLVDRVPSNLGGAAGSWTSIMSGSVPSGQLQVAAPYNPYLFRQTTACGDASNGFVDAWAMYRLKVTSNNSAIQVHIGRSEPHKYGGFVLHGIDAAGEPSKTPKEFWHSVYEGGFKAWGASITAFASAKDMVVQVTTEPDAAAGWPAAPAFSATYTTTGPDQPIVKIDPVGSNANCGLNYKFKVIGGPSDALVGVVCGSLFTERGYSAPFLTTGTHYEILAPPVVFIGQNFWITVVVLMQGGGTKTNYTGTTSFSSTDPLAKILGGAMDAYNYTWIAGDLGVRIFINVQMNRLGLINLVASDILDGSITGMTTIMVVGADVKLEKRNKLSVAASGDTVQFWICWSNFSTATAYSFTITDAIPRGTEYVPELSNNALCGQDGPATATVSLAQAISASTTPPNAAFTTIATGTSGSNTARWLRWTVRDVYVNSTGCVCFKVLVQ